MSGPIESYNVKLYGAYGNATVGVPGSGQDDTSYIQKAYNDASLGQGGMIYFPPGTYRTTSPIILPSLGMGCYNTVGAGQNAATIYPDGAGSGVTFDIFKSSMTGGIGRNGTTFHDFSINFGGITAAAGSCFNIPYLLHSIRDVFVYEGFNFLTITSYLNTYIENNLVYGCPGTMFIINGSGATGGLYVTDNHFQCDGAAMVMSIAASTGQIMYVKFNDFEGFYKGIALGLDAQLHDSIFQGNTWDEDILSNTSGPYYDFSVGATSKVKIRDEWIVGGPGPGAIIDIGPNAYNVTVEGCDIDANGTDAIRVSGGSGIKIQDNDLGASTGAGVHITAGSSAMVMVKGNTCLGAGTGILIDSGAGKWVVNGNDCSGAGTPLTNNGGPNVLGSRYVGQNIGVDI